MDSSKNDFKTLKRKDLQRLCKKYGLRANSTNSKMADSLASFFKIREENIQEEVEGNAEKVLIILDKEEDEHDLNQKSCSGVSGDMEGTKVQWHEENSIIFLDEEDHEPVPVHTDELVQSEVDLTSSQILESGASSNLASSSPKLLLLEWKGGQVQKKEDLKTLDGRFYEALEESVSTDLEDLTEAPKTTGNDALTCQGLVLSGNKFHGRVADYEQEKSENPQRFLDSQRQAEIKSGQIAPFDFNKRVDNVLEKLLCLTKVLRGEIPLVVDSSLPCEEEISHEDCERNSTNSETLDDRYSIPNEQECAQNPVAIYEVESRDISMSRTDDTFTVANPFEHKASVSRNDVDPIEEISRKLVKFCISSSRKPSKYNIIKTPRINSPGTFKHHSSMGNLRGKENTKSSELKYSSSKQKMRNSASAGSIRRPLRSVTNRMID